jgi:WD40 repeat protein
MGIQVVINRHSHRAINAITFSPNGSDLLTVSDDGTFRVWVRAEY